MSLLDAVQDHIGQTGIGGIADQLGISPDAAQTAVAAALPMIVAGMARHASTSPESADAIHQAAAAHAGVVDDVSSVLRAGPPADVGGGILGRILGGHQPNIQQGVQQASGLDAEKVKKLLMMLAPVVLGVLARKQFGNAPSQAQPGAADVGGYLQEQGRVAQEHVERQAPGIGGILGQILGRIG